ncbi:pitrilysin family protein [Roseibacterium sp. SDUM158017]|uniref:M16 family metallopeptidase n=1 Tax=Roseicyclus salinarum TaxID=3036773 RepID=UPI0024153441|nr:pitrilysin family protein [Roseibacterium sp. SDUM158017]MDG4650542.1 pitrilysin family protein [Roseibacterium sp. SDUM158017]
MIPRLSGLLTAAILAIPGAAQAIDIQEVTSPGGIEAWLVEDDSIPFVAIDIWFDGGGSLDPDGARGAVHLMTGLLEEGAGDMDARGFAEAVEGLAAGFEFDVYRDALTVSARMLTRNRDEAADLLRAALVEPRFDEDAIERVRGQVLSMIEGDARDPDEIASATFNRMAWGDHPYGSQLEGTRESVSALTRDDIVAAHDAVLARDRVIVGAAGDITAEELGLLVDRILGDLPAEGAPLPGMAEYRLDGGTTVVDFPSPQSVALFGHEGIARDDPDFFPAFVLNQILGGGGFRSRLMEEVRVERGLTYGVSSFLGLSEYGQTVAGRFSSSNDLVAEAIAVIRDQWADVAENGVTENELGAAKRYLTGAYPLRFDGNGRIAGILAGMQADGMPAEYILTRNDRVDAVTLEDVRRVAARLLAPNELHFVVVGQPEGLEPSN